jgi:hypothetical protein
MLICRMRHVGSNVERPHFINERRLGSFSDLVLSAIVPLAEAMPSALWPKSSATKS